MEQAEFDKLMRLVKLLSEKVHRLGLAGLTPWQRLRQIASRTEVRYGEKEQAWAETSISKITDMIDNHLVEKAEKEQTKIVRNIFKAFKNYNLALFNQLVAEKKDMYELDELAKKAKDIPDAELRKQIMQLLKEFADEWHASLKQSQELANKINAEAQDRTTVANSLTQLMHSRGASWVMRTQEQRLIGQATKDFAKAEDLIKQLEKLRKSNSKEKDKAKSDLALLQKLEKKGIEELEKFDKLITLNLSDLINDLNRLEKTVKKAASDAERELPRISPEQLAKLHDYFATEMVEKFEHSIRLSAEQLDSICQKIDKDLKALQ